MLDPDEDAFGRHLLDHLEGRTGVAMLERDDGYIRPALQAPAFFTDFDDWWPSERAATGHVVGRVLDVGCGAGRHALYLQDRGHDVLGIDRSPLAVEVARQRGVRDVEVMTLQDLAPRLGRFDTVLMFCGGFGIFGSVEGARDGLRRLNDLTTDRGRIIAESVDPHVTDEPEHIEYMRRNVEVGRMAGQMRLRIRYRHFADPWTDWLNASHAEVTDIVSGTGWRIAQRIDENEVEFVVVLEKT